MSGDRPIIPADRLEDLRRRLLAAVRRSCPPYLASHAEDIAQEALLKIVGILQRSGETESALPSSYLKKAAYHAIVDAMRCNRYQGSAEVPMLEAAESARDEQTHTDPERASLSSAIREGIRRCLEAIGGSRRAAAVLHLQGHSVPEVGALMGWTLTQSTNLVFRGLKDLRRCLEKKGLTP